MNELGSSQIFFPNQKSEEWRKISFRGIPNDWFLPIQNSGLVLKNKLREKLNNDYFLLESIQNSTPIIIDNLEKEFYHEKIFKDALSRDVVSIQVKANTELDLHFKFQSHSDREISGSNVSIILYIPENSKVNLKVFLDYHSTHISFLNIFSELGRNAKLNSISVLSGGLKGKSRNHCYLQGEGAEFVSSGLSLLGGRESHFWDYKAIHDNNHQFSNILHKASVSSRSHHVFMGNLDIPPHLKGVQSSQLSQNLLLDPTARAESIPNLEVKASNVNCVHGATVGELDEEQIYFLRSRGLTEGESKRLLWEGFLNSILDQIFEEEEKNKMMPLWSQKLWRSK